MKKLFLVVSLLGAMVASADDSYLYWMVDTTMAATDYAKIRTESSSSYLNIYNEGFGSEGTQVSGTTVAGAAAWGEGFYADISDVQLGNTFIVELFNEGGTFLGQSVMSIAANSGAIYKGGMGLPSTSAATFSSFSIPEPNSALLMLVGCAMLGLRRRKLQAA